MKIRTISEELKKEYGIKIYRLSLSSGCTCPNRDGKIGTGGCTFCSEGGSGDFAAPPLPVEEQIRLARKRVDAKIPASVAEKDRRYIAYFQSYTNTYGDPERLKHLYMETINRPEIVILSLGTRPDCLPPEILSMLAELQAIKPVWIELGLQTIHEKTAQRIRRGYTLPVFEKAYQELRAMGIPVIVHVILGLPGETRKDMMETADYLASLSPVLSGIKIQLLHVLRGTALAAEYQDAFSNQTPTPSDIASAEGYPAALPTQPPTPSDGDAGMEKNTDFRFLSMGEYADLTASFLSRLPEETVVHRMTGDGPRNLLIGPLWSTDKKRVLNLLHRKIAETPRLYGAAVNLSLHPQSRS